MSRPSATPLRVPAGALSPATPPGRRAALALAAILAVGAVVGIVFGLWPRLDLAVTSLVWDEARRFFPYTYTQALQTIRDVNDGLVRAVAVAAGVVLILWLAAPRVAAARLPRALSLRAAAFVLATLAVAPGLIINGILKPHGGRPRPIEVTQFGGTLDFVPWWSPFGRCDSNCSFASGEMSSAMWLLSVAVLLPARWRPLGVAAVLAWALAVGGVRIAMGGHFTSDVLMSAVLTALTVWVLHALILRPGRAA
ncbi:phosphatase PAP2 family protein [Rhodoplanes sp. TEM]|uniref:Phosphatase PAP2 family protein n=1 Tax=Rhodoplanes tepidamans TaxID=200616 RepID=A0ABT5JH20_RHOTP|nr:MULTISPECIES: phosphatase PAP2 family protein [Rhodoplanes]MDC7788879.1 phosphatase PAP2 family protein [Rhodoplanes tepidamans]MDC7987512.1 phosphatase PAP2 family protein [Rhodoplanes sp. TEM]MDQ0355115.1 membrane-associated PAP2 superfamily phosphatase [Rhodoplanes tepidamans]